MLNFPSINRKLFLIESQERQLHIIEENNWYLEESSRSASSSDEGKLF